MSAERVMHRLRAAEERARTLAPAPAAFLWFSVAVRECVEARPLLEVIAQRTVERALYGVPADVWPVDVPEMRPLVAVLRGWFEGRFPGRWGDLGHPSPEELPDRSREAGWGGPYTDAREMGHRGVG